MAGLDPATSSQGHVNAKRRLGLHHDQSPERHPVVGTSTDLARRAWEHRTGVADSFTKRYGLSRLVYAERYEDILMAKQRERNIKHWSRAWKIELILKDNPNWEDLYDGLA